MEVKPYPLRDQANPACEGVNDWQNMPNTSYPNSSDHPHWEVKPYPSREQANPSSEGAKGLQAYRVHLGLAHLVNIMGHLDDPTIPHKTLVTKTTLLCWTEILR